MKKPLLLISMLSTIGTAGLMAQPGPPKGKLPPPPPPEDMALFVIEEFDDNLNGTIDIEELDVALQSLHEMRHDSDSGSRIKSDRPKKDFPPPPIDPIFVASDTDQDLELNEFELIYLFKELERLHRGGPRPGDKGHPPSNETPEEKH